MRPIGLVAAAAAGLIAPLAIAMPALAGTESPVLSGMSSIVDGDNGPDNGDDKGDNGDNGPDNGYNGDDNGNYNGDDNGNHHGDDNGNHHGDDNGDNHGDDRDDNGDDYDGPYLSAYSAGSKASGDVSFIVDVDDAGPFDTYELESPGLEAGCDSTNISGATAESDRFGDLNVSGEADNCIPGKYKIAVFQTGGQEETYYVDVHVD